MNKIYDKTGREIKLFDVIKIFHFRTKRKKYYMYKHVVGERTTQGTDYFLFSHLSEDQSTYMEVKDNKIREDMEIVQGYGGEGVSYEDRERKRQ